MENSKQQAINLYQTNLWEKFLSNFKFWEEPYEVVNKMLTKSGTITELGCGEGLMTNYLALSSPKRQIIGYEIVPERLKIAKKNIKNTLYEVGDIVEIPFPKSDALILFHVLHHLPSKSAQEKVLIKAKKALKKNGKLVIVDVHVRPTIKYYAAWIADHFLVPWVFEKRFYTRAYFRTEQEWLTLLKKIGYKVKTSEETAGRPFPNIIFECTL
ncbi:MAG: class I SAM-dependent methyltransferase [bacterium]|nr:class I SAM-dependent methyltransferase [bacterium]